MYVVLIVASITDDESLRKHHWWVVINLQITWHIQTNLNHSSAANKDTSVTSGLNIGSLDIMSKRSTNILKNHSTKKSQQ